MLTRTKVGTLTQEEPSSGFSTRPVLTGSILVCFVRFAPVNFAHRPSLPLRTIHSSTSSKRCSRVPPSSQVPPQAQPEQSDPQGERFSPGCDQPGGGRLRPPPGHRVRAVRSTRAGEPHEARRLRGLPRQRGEGGGLQDGQEEGDRHRGLGSAGEASPWLCSFATTAQVRWMRGLLLLRRYCRWFVFVFYQYLFS